MRRTLLKLFSTENVMHIELEEIFLPSTQLFGIRYLLNMLQDFSAIHKNSFINPRQIKKERHHTG